MSNRAASLATLPEAQIYLGRRFDGAKAYYDVSRAANFNIGIAGFSGSGKSHAIRHLVGGFSRLGVTQYVLDVHGDLDAFTGVPPERVNHIACGYQRGAGTINPLRVAPEEGPFLAIRTFETEVVKRFAPQMGIKQMRMMRALLVRTFEHYGISKDAPESWGREGPTVQDVLDYALCLEEQLEQPDQCEGDDVGVDDVFAVRRCLTPDLAERLASGGSQEDYAALGRATYESIAGLQRARRAPKLRVNDNAETLAGVVQVLQDICDSGLFGGDSLRPKAGVINRFMLRDVAEKDRQIVTHLLLDRIFQSAVRTARELNPPLPRFMVWLDEGKTVRSISLSEMSPLNRIGTEGRKFGLGVGLGVQAPRHLTDDVFDNCALFMILKQHPARVKEAVRMFGVDKHDLDTIKPKSSGLVFQNTGRFEPVYLFRE